MHTPTPTVQASAPIDVLRGRLRRFERLVSLHAPSFVLRLEGRLIRQALFQVVRHVPTN